MTIYTKKMVQKKGQSNNTSTRVLQTIQSQQN